MGRLVAGVDSSTQSTTVVVVDPETGVQVARGRAPHEVGGTAGARESDPLGWWLALRDALAATGCADDIAAISIGAQQHGLVVLDGSGAPLRPAILWNDTRSGPQTDRLVSMLGREAWAERVGSVPVPSFTVTRWAWLREVEPAVAAATRGVRLPHDYLTERLTGEAVTDRGDASGTGWWSTASGTYDTAILASPSVDLDPTMLPRVLAPDQAAGVIREAAARELGLPLDVIVGIGTGDNMASALGLGVRSGTPVISLGTSGVAYAVSERRPMDPTGTVAGFADATGRFLPLTATLNCTLAVDRVAGWLGLDRDAVAPSDGVVSLPWFDGERTPNLPDAQAAILGLRHDTPPGAILGATYEGAVVGLLDALEAISDCSDPLDPEAPIVLIGGGARGRAWQDTVRRLSGRAVRVPTETDLGARGAAIQAAAALSGTDPVSIQADWLPAETTELEPLPVDEAVLARYRTVREGRHRHGGVAQAVAERGRPRAPRLACTRAARPERGCPARPRNPGLPGADHWSGQATEEASRETPGRADPSPSPSFGITPASRATEDASKSSAAPSLGSPGMVPLDQVPDPSSKPLRLWRAACQAASEVVAASAEARFCSPMVRDVPPSSSTRSQLTISRFSGRSGRPETSLQWVCTRCRGGANSRISPEST